MQRFLRSYFKTLSIGPPALQPDAQATEPQVAVTQLVGHRFPELPDISNQTLFPLNLLHSSFMISPRFLEPTISRNSR